MSCDSPINTKDNINNLYNSISSEEDLISSEKLKDRALPLALTHVILNKFQSPKQAETVAGRMQRVFGVNVNAHAMDDD